MKGAVIGLLIIAFIAAAIALAKYVSTECAVRSLVRAAKEEHRRTLYIFDDVPHGDVTLIDLGHDLEGVLASQPRSALISRMPQPGRV